MLLKTSLATAFEIDFSRRRGPNSVGNTTVPAAGTPTPTLSGSTEVGYRSKPEEPRSLFQDLFSPHQTSQEVVILITENGFIPKMLQLRKGQKYVIHVVNVNERNKNVSFVLDAFSEFHATYFGKMKTFEIQPKQEGIYDFQSPESTFAGKFVVLSESTSGRAPASR